MYRTDFGLYGRRRGWDDLREQHRNVYYQVWNRSPVQVGCMRQVLGAGALGWPRGMGWRGRWEGGSGWGTHVNPLLIHVNVWQKPLQYCKVISLQLIKINGGKKKRDVGLSPRLGRSPGGGNDNTLQYYCLENSMARGAWWVHGVVQHGTQLSIHIYSFSEYFPL